MSVSTHPGDVDALFARPLERAGNVHVASQAGASENELHTNDAFSEKWVTLNQDANDETEGWKQAQFRWYLHCYGFGSEEEFAEFLSDRRTILDAGCGPGYKAAWFARLAPHATVVAMDLSDSIVVAAKRYADVANMVFVKGDIARTPFVDGVFDFISCDQVLHHTDDPPQTLAEFARILAPDGVLATYVYARKALPRELLDEHFREASKALSKDQIWELSDQLTVLGRTLSELNLTVDIPDMPLLGIKGGPQDLQRFIYWNFLKCYWNPEFGFDACRMTNFDWYAPSTAFRYSMDEFRAMAEAAGFKANFLLTQEACHTGRFSN